MRRIVGFAFFALLAATSLLAASGGMAAEERALQGDAVRGGRLYDNWVRELRVEPPPEGNQPLWNDQEANHRQGLITWRCAECHGWDYKGADGANGGSSIHYTGFPGLSAEIGGSRTRILDWLDGSVNPRHNFALFMSQAAIDDLVVFLRTRQVDTDLIIDARTGAAFGSPQKGMVLYIQNCVTCHGNQGEKMNFGNQANPLHMGDLAVADPWQFLHKLRFGAPGEDMPAYEDENWSLSMFANLLAYAQTLPRINPAYTTFGLDQQIDVQSQGQIEPIIYAALGILAVILISLVWDSFAKRKSPSASRN